MELKSDVFDKMLKELNLAKIGVREKNRKHIENIEKIIKELKCSSR